MIWVVSLTQERTNESPSHLSPRQPILYFSKRTVNRRQRLLALLDPAVVRGYAVAAVDFVGADRD